MLLILRGIRQSAVGHQIAWGLAKSPQNWFAKWSKSYQIAGSLGPYAVCPGSPDLGRFVQTSRRFVQPGRVPLRFVGFAHFATLHPPRLAKSREVWPNRPRYGIRPDKQRRGPSSRRFGKILPILRTSSEAIWPDPKRFGTLYQNVFICIALRVS